MENRAEDLKMKCRECEREFAPNKPWQEFCCAQHRDAWHYRERKRAAVEAAEERRAERMNGHDNGAKREEKIDLVALGLASKLEPIKRRRFA
jgi:hypothetical protein